MFPIYLGNVMVLIIGLGNPGKEYRNTRHNIGFIAVDKLVKQYNSSFSTKKKFNCKIAESSKEGENIVFMKPTTYMNLSGKSVISVKAYYNISLEKIFVIHDDADLDIGRVKFKTGGGNSGHNGLKSIDQNVGNNYNRIRIGISRPKNNEDMASYVLNNFPKSEYEIAKQVVCKITNNFDLILKNKLEEFKNEMA